MWTVTSLALISLLILASGACKFGPGCMYPCHCQGGDECDRDTGACSSGCDDGRPDPNDEDDYHGEWTGPGCQVGNVAYNQSASRHRVNPGCGADYPADLAVDGNINQLFGECAFYCHTDRNDNGWWNVEFDQEHVIMNVIVYPCEGGGYYTYLRSSVFEVGFGDDYVECGRIDQDTPSSSAELVNITCVTPLIGTALKITRQDGTNRQDVICLCEVLANGYILQACECGFYGPGCLLACDQCEYGCDNITGDCLELGDQGSCNGDDIVTTVGFTSEPELTPSGRPLTQPESHASSETPATSSATSSPDTSSYNPSSEHSSVDYDVTATVMEREVNVSMETDVTTPPNHSTWPTPTTASSTSCECGFYGPGCLLACDQCEYGCDNITGDCLELGDQGSCTRGSEDGTGAADECVCRMRGDPVINTYDDQVLRIVRGDRYLMSKLVTTEDDCWFTVEVNTVDADHHGFTRNIPHSLDIEFATSHIHFEPNHVVQVGSEVIDLSTGAYENNGAVGFRIYENKDQSFIVFESSESSNCSISLGFSGGYKAGYAEARAFAAESMIRLEVSSRYAGRMSGLCGNCDGEPDFDGGRSVDDQKTTGDRWVVKDILDESWKEE